MNFRPKTKRRLLILLIGGISIIGAGVIFVVLQLHRYENHRLAFRAAGMAAFEQGDYRTAADDLSRYLVNDRMDGEAIFDYGIARSKLPQADLKNLIDARDSFKLYLEINNGDVACEHQLLGVYQKLNYSSDAIDLSHELLRANPDDVPALLAELTELIHQQQYQTALPVAMHLNDLTPFDVQTQGTTYELMWHLQKPGTDLTNRADQMVKAHPDDPRFELLRAVAAYWTGDVEGSKRWLRTAATRPPPDSGFVMMLTGAFDHVGLWSDALGALEKNAITPIATATIKASLLQRWWESGKFDRAIELTNQLDSSDPKTDSNLLGQRAFSLFGKYQTEKKALSPEFDADLQVLQHRPDDPMASCWGSVLLAITEPNPTDPMKPVRLLEDARRMDPTNSDACFFLGRQYFRIGESELGLQALRQTTQLQPEWAAPFAFMARAQMNRGQLDVALQSVEQAVARDPNSTDAQTALAMVRYRQIPSDANASDCAPELEFIAQLKNAGAHDDELLVAEVDLLARSNRSQNSRAAALALLEKASPTTLKLLAATNRSDQLGIEKQLNDRLVEYVATKPDQALAQIQAEIILENAAAAQPVLRAMQARQTPGWQTAWLQARDAINDSSDGVDWKKLAELFPHDVDVQNATLHSTFAATDRSLMDRTIDRLKTITGEDAIEWKLARADWQLGDDQKNNANAAAASMAEVTRVAPGYARPQIIWADALEKLDDPVGAIAHLRLAMQIEPGNVDLSIKLANILADQGQIQELRALLARIRTDPLITNLQCIDTAMLYRQTGDRTTAIQLLQNATRNHRAMECDLVLAQLHAELAEDTDARQIYDRWFKEDPNNPKVLRAFAGFMASRGNIAQARQTLLASDLPFAEKTLIEAEFESQWGDPSVAAADFQKCDSEVSDDARIWLEWSGMNVRQHDFSGAFYAANQGLKHIPSNAALIAMKDRAQALAGLQLEGGLDGKLNGDYQDLLNTLAIDPTNEPAIATLLALTGSETPGDAIEKLRAVAEKYPRFLAVQTLIIRKDFHAGLFDQATDRATRVCAVLPIEAEPAQLLTAIYSTAHAWDRALTAANEWRNRSLDHPHPADIAIATAEIGLQQPQRAESQLEWCLNGSAPPDTIAIETVARALCAQGRVDQAWRILQPYCTQPPWRQRWLGIVSTDSVDPNVALQYMQKVSPQCQSDLVEDQLALGHAWLTVATRLNDAGDVEKARLIVEPLTTTNATNPDAFILLGNIQQQQNNLSAAEKSFSSAEKMAPENAVAKNNLAMVMWLGNEDLKTAKQMATHAISLTPTESAFHSTLGEIDMQMNDIAGAKSEFQIAMRLNVENAEALIGAAVIEDRTGDSGNMAGTLNQAKLILISSHELLPAKVREEFEALQAKYIAR